VVGAALLIKALAVDCKRKDKACTYKAVMKSWLIGLPFKQMPPTRG
jgi:hypothetical protein